MDKLIQKVRLESWETNAIIESFNDCFTEGDELWLFGSRVDLSRRGGDIDLFIDTKLDDEERLFKMELSFLRKVKNRIGEQKIDVVIKHDNNDLLIYKVAKNEGVRLR